MKITNFGPKGQPIVLAGWSTGIVSLNSNVEIIGGGPAALNFVQRITSNTSNTLLNPIVNFASGSNIAFAVASNTLTIIGTAAAGGGGGGSSDAILGQVGIGGAIIPGLQGSADIRVAGASDDEFDTTDTSDPMTGWTTLGTPSAHDINSTVKSHYYVATTTASVALMGIYKAKSPGFTVTCKMSDYFFTSNASMRAGLFISEASPGAISSIAVANFGTVQVTAWTNRTTFASNPQSLAGPSTYMYFRIVVTSSTNVAYYVSINGLVWTAFLTGHNPGFTVGAAGLFVNHGGATTEAVFDWIRFT